MFAGDAAASPVSESRVRLGRPRQIRDKQVPRENEDCDLDRSRRAGYKLCPGCRRVFDELWGLLRDLEFEDQWGYILCKIRKVIVQSMHIVGEDAIIILKYKEF